MSHQAESDMLTPEKNAPAFKSISVDRLQRQEEAPIFNYAPNVAKDGLPTTGKVDCP